MKTLLEVLVKQNITNSYSDLEVWEEKKRRGQTYKSHYVKVDSMDLLDEITKYKSKIYPNGAFKFDVFKNAISEYFLQNPDLGFENAYILLEVKKGLKSPEVLTWSYCCKGDMKRLFKYVETINLEDFNLDYWKKKKWNGF